MPTISMRKRVLAGVAGIVTALAVGLATAAPSSAYIDSCDDPVAPIYKWVPNKHGELVLKTVGFKNLVSGLPVSTWDKAHILQPDIAKDSSGYFTVPVPKKFRGKATRVSVQFVDWVGTAQWMADSKTYREWGGGYQVWAHTTLAPAGKTLRVGVPNSDPIYDVQDFEFEVTFTASIGGKKAREAFLVFPVNRERFAQYEQDSNGLTFLDLRQP